MSVLRTRRSRAITAGAVGVLAYIAGGFSVGVLSGGGWQRGVALAAVSAAFVVTVTILTGVVIAVARWIYRGES